MFYCIIGTDRPDADTARKAARAAHLARLEALRDADRLKLAGPFPASDTADAPVTGSLIVAAFDDLAAAESWAGDDPYVEAGVYAEVSVRPFKAVLP